MIKIAAKGGREGPRTGTGLQRGGARVALGHRRLRPPALRPGGGEPHPERGPLRPPRLSLRAGRRALS